MIRPDPAPSTSKTVAPADIAEDKLLGHLLDLYTGLNVEKKTDVPVAADRWNGKKIRLVGIVESSGLGDYNKPMAQLRDKSTRTNGVRCRFPEGTTKLPKVGVVVTVEGIYKATTHFVTWSPLSYWNTELALIDCVVVTPKR